MSEKFDDVMYHPSLTEAGEAEMQKHKILANLNDVGPKMFLISSFEVL